MPDSNVISATKLQRLRKLPWANIPGVKYAGPVSKHLWAQSRRELRLAGKTFSKVPILSGLFLGSHLFAGKDLPEGIMHLGTEAAAWTVSGLGYTAAKRIIPIAGRAVGRVAGRMIGATAARVLGGAAARIGAAGIGGVTVASGGTALLAFAASWGIYEAAKYTIGLGFKDIPTQNFGEAYYNRRALTMRQASQMRLSQASRSAFGHEAKLMHLR